MAKSFEEAMVALNELLYVATFRGYTEGSKNKHSQDYYERQNANYHEAYVDLIKIIKGIFEENQKLKQDRSPGGRFCG